MELSMNPILVIVYGGVFIITLSLLLRSRRTVKDDISPCEDNKENN